MSLINLCNMFFKVPNYSVNFVKDSRSFISLEHWIWRKAVLPTYYYCHSVRLFRNYWYLNEVKRGKLFSRINHGVNFVEVVLFFRCHRDGWPVASFPVQCRTTLSAREKKNKKKEDRNTHIHSYPVPVHSTFEWQESIHVTSPEECFQK